MAHNKSVIRQKGTEFDVSAAESLVWAKHVRGEAMSRTEVETRETLFARMRRNGLETDRDKILVMNRPAIREAYGLRSAFA